NSLHRKAQAALVVGFDDLDADHLADLQHIVDVGDAIVRDLGDVQQAITAGQDLNDGTEIEQTQYSAFVLLADFNVCSQLLDTAFCFARLVKVRTGDGDAAVVADIDLSTGFFGQCADGGAALTDHIPNLFGVDLDAEHARGELG